MIVILKESILNGPWCFHVKGSENWKGFSVILMKNSEDYGPFQK